MAVDGSSPTSPRLASPATLQGYADNPFATYGSRDLRDNPNALYQKMAGSSNADTDYRFKVVPHNNSYNGGAGADADSSACAPLRVTLDNRSVADQAKEDPRHVGYDFGSWDGHGVGALLDSGVLTAETTDLSIATWGPSAALSRTYSSAQTSAGLFAPGWFFVFEQNLQIAPTQIVYTDAERMAHTFTGSGSTWNAPNGYLATLSAPTKRSDWRLTFFDQSYLTFDGVGRLIGETDKDGNTTTYTWSGGLMTQITAANGQSINLTYSGSKLSSVSYSTSAGTRTVNYTTAAPWSATLYPSTAVQKKVTYAYDANTRLSSITQNDWPSAGQSAAEGFTYTSGKVTEVRYADYNATTKPDARASVTYATNQATIDHYGTVSGIANQVKNHEVLTWSGATAGVPNLLATRTTGSGGLALTETYNYAFDRQLATTTSSDGGQTNDTINTQHDLTSETTTTDSLDAANQTTSYVYDGQHRVTSETDYQSPTVYSVTTNTYSGADLTAEQTTDQTATVLSAASYTYSSGRLTQEKKLVSGTVQSGTWTQTDYSNFAPSGDPQTTIARSIKLSPGGAAQDLTTTASYDAFGNLLTETDWSNARTIATNTYDIAGNRLTSTDSASVATHTNYDCMGNAAERYQTASGTNMKANWTVTTYDAVGRDLTVTTKLSDASGNGTTQSVVTPTFDGSGDELSSHDSTVGGQDAKTLYDSSGNATEEWAAGVANYTDAGRSTRSLYDAESNDTYRSDPGNTNAPGSGATCTANTYDAAGNLLSNKRPDGTKTTHTYDGQQNHRQTEAEATSSSDFLPWNQKSSYDAAGREVRETDAQQSHTGLVTTTTVDKLGRTTAATAQRDGFSGSTTTTTYNDLGWVLQSQDANGVTTSTTYDAHGAVTSQTVGSKTTTTSYDATTGRLQSRTDNDGTVVTYTYDAFGNVKRELHQTGGGTTLKDLGGSSGTVFDSLGRPTSQTEVVSGITHTWSYPQNAATGVQETLAYDATPLTSLSITRNGRGMETGRTATIAPGTTVTRSVSDPAGRDTADRWTTATIQQSGHTAKTMSRSFDVAGRLATQSGLGFSSAAGYTYDPNSGLKTAESLPLTLGGTIADTFGYYPGGRLAKATTGGVDASYTFDEAGNLVCDAVTGVGTTTFSYDSANRLTRSGFTPALEGAATTTTYYGWDTTNAWRTCQGPTANPTPANEPITYSYNAQGRMASYANSTTSTSASYTYDASGQRIRSVVTIGATTTTTSFAYDGLSLLKLSATQGSTSWRIDYLYDEDGNAYGGVYRSPATSTSPTYFTLVTSDRGDTVELCDADGNPFAAYRYEAWGSPQGSGSYATGMWTQSTSLVSSTLAGQIASRQVLRYAGYAYDGESGLYYCSARYYDPATRQWTTGDPATSHLPSFQVGLLGGCPR